MKSLVAFIILLCFQQISFSQVNSFHDTAAFYFREVKQTTKDYKNLWKLDLYAPLLLVDPATREVYANSPDTAGVLSRVGNIYTGILPQSVNISNTSLLWSGKHWAMVMLPLSKNKQSRINLLCHELFHRAQQQLGFVPSNPENNHLDKKEGRIFLRLELEALKKAVFSSQTTESRRHIRNAIIFRKVRHQMYPGSDSTENLLELNEGISEYTGIMMSGRNANEMRENLTKRIDDFISSASYIRSFAYETIPVYGYKLSSLDAGWNKKITALTNLTAFFENAFGLGISLNELLENEKIRSEYCYDKILEEESIRDEELKKTLSAYKAMFIDSPHVELPLIKMNMSFDYTKMIALENYGTVYPSIRITDAWGILEVGKGAMINSSWQKIHVSYPKNLSGDKIEGDGWVLHLNDDYIFYKEAGTSNYILKKKN